MPAALTYPLIALIALALCGPVVANDAPTAALTSEPDGGGQLVDATNTIRGEAPTHDHCKLAAPTFQVTPDEPSRCTCRSEPMTSAGSVNGGTTAQNGSTSVLRSGPGSSGSCFQSCRRNSKLKAKCRKVSTSVANTKSPLRGTATTKANPRSNTGSWNKGLTKDPGDANTTSKSCRQGDCFTNATDNNKKYRQHLTQDRTDRYSSISDANIVARDRLASAENRVDDLNSSGQSAARTTARYDQPLVSMAKQAVLGDGKFTAQDASRARDPQVRRDLEEIANFTKAEKNLQSSLPAIDNEIKAIDLNLAQLTKDSAAIASVERSASGAADQKRRNDGSDTVAELPAKRGAKTDAALASDLSSDGEISHVHAPQGLHKPSLDDSSVFGANAKSQDYRPGAMPSSDTAIASREDQAANAPDSKRGSLRDRLRAKLKEYDAIKKAGSATTDEALASFDRDLNAEGAPREYGERALASSSGEALRSMMQNAAGLLPEQEGESARLGIVAGDVSDTVALMRAQLDEQHGIAEAESEPLFVRVHRYHAAWAKRR